MKVTLKKTVVAALAALLVTGTAVAQSAPTPKALARDTVTLTRGQSRGFGQQWDNRGPRNVPAPKAPKAPRPAPVEQTLQGTLSLKDGMLALKGDTTTYYLPGLQRFVGFIDGLKDGAKVTVKGYVNSTDHGEIVHSYELDINGKTYEVGRKWVEVPAAK